MSQSPESTRSTQNATNSLLSLPSLNTGNDSLPKQSKRSFWRRPGGIILIILVLLVLLVGGLILRQSSIKTPLSLQYQAIQQGDIAQTISATGPIQSSGTYNLAAGVTTTINEIDVKVGQTVRKGQVLARFDKTSLQQQVDADQASVDSAQATVDSDQLTLDNDYNYGVGQAQILPAQAQLSGAQAQLTNAQIQLSTAKHNLNSATLTAPHSGVITAINGQVGSTPGGTAASSSSGNTSSSSTSGTSSNTSASSGSTFIQIIDLSSLQIQANINESDMANLQVGNPVQFTVNAYGDQQFTGTVSAISPAGATNSNVVTYPATINVNMKSVKSAHLFPGMTADTTITVIQHHNVTLIPVNAINFAQQASSNNSTTGTPQLINLPAATAATQQAQQMLTDLENQNSSLATQNPIATFVLEKGTNGQYIAKPVVLGLTDGTSYEVLSSTPQAGETIIVGTGSSLAPGSNAAPTGNGNSVKGG